MLNINFLAIHSSIAQGLSTWRVTQVSCFLRLNWSWQNRKGACLCSPASPSAALLSQRSKCLFLSADLHWLKGTHIPLAYPCHALCWLSAPLIWVTASKALKGRRFLSPSTKENLSCRATRELLRPFPVLWEGNPGLSSPRPVQPFWGRGSHFSELCALCLKEKKKTPHLNWIMERLSNQFRKTQDWKVWCKQETNILEILNSRCKLYNPTHSTPAQISESFFSFFCLKYKM